MDKICKIIMGLDVSTSTIGVNVCPLFEDGEIKPVVATSFSHKIKNVKSSTEALFQKSSNFKRELSKFEQYNISHVVIEEPLVSSNNSLTASTLLRYNGMISQAIYDVLGIVPDFISSYEARKYAFPELLGIRICNKKGEKYDVKKIKKLIENNEIVLFGEYPFDTEKKKVLWNLVSKKFDNIYWEYNKKGELKKENYDVSDSLVCTLGYINKEKYKDIVPKSSILCENDSEIIYNIEFGEKTFQKSIAI